MGRFWPNFSPMSKSSESPSLPCNCMNWKSALNMHHRAFTLLKYAPRSHALHLAMTQGHKKRWALRPTPFPLTSQTRWRCQFITLVLNSECQRAFAHQIANPG